MPVEKLDFCAKVGILLDSNHYGGLGWTKNFFFLKFGFNLPNFTTLGGCLLKIGLLCKSWYPNKQSTITGHDGKSGNTKKSGNIGKSLITGNYGNIWKLGSLGTMGKLGNHENMGTQGTLRNLGPQGTLGNLLNLGNLKTLRSM